MPTNFSFGLGLMTQVTSSKYLIFTPDLKKRFCKSKSFTLFQFFLQQLIFDL